MSRWKARLSRARKFGATVPPLPGIGLLSRPFVAPTVIGSVPVGGAVVDTASDFVYAKGRGSGMRVAVNYVDDGNYVWIQGNDGDGGFVPWVRVNGVDTDLGFVPISGGVPSGHRIHVVRDDKSITWSYATQSAPDTLIPFKTRTLASIGISTLSSKVKFFYADGTSNVEAGSNGSVLAINAPTYNALTRSATITGFYTDVAPGSPPNYPEIRYTGSSAWRPMTVTANSRAGVFEATDAGIPASFDGATTPQVRWNNKPATVVTTTLQITTPFAKMLGVNGGGYSTDIITSWEWLNSYQQMVGSYPQHPSDGNANQFADWFESPGVNQKIPASADGLNGTIMRDQRNGFGRNSVGVITYCIRSIHVIGAPINAYIDWPPGTEVRQRYNTSPAGFQHNITTGRSTFPMVAGGNHIELLITVATIPAGQLCYPIVKDIAAPSVSPLLASVNPVAKGLRFLDSGQHNNPNNMTRTLTAMPVRTLQNRRLDGAQSFEGQAADLRSTNAKFAYGIFNHIDDDALVAAFADHWAANTPSVQETFFGGGNEYFNVIFLQYGDGILMGLRAGYGPADATPQNAVPEVILDGQANGIPAIVQMTDANGGNTGERYVKTLRPFAAGDKFYKNIGGGVFCYEFLQDVPAGFIWDKGTDYPQVRIKYDSNRCVIASKRIQGEIISRQGNIARQRYALAGKKAPNIVLEAQSGGLGNALPSLDWNNTWQNVDYVSHAPYFNNNEVGIGGFMDWNDATIWTPEAKAKAISGDYDGALTLTLPGMLLSIDKQTRASVGMADELRAYCVSKGLPADKIKLIAYEFGDHNGFSGYNWPSNANAGLFMNFFWADQRSYTVFMRYLVGLGSVGVPMFLYAFGPGPRPFGLVKDASDVATSGPNTNWYYKAMKDMQDLIAALP